MKITIFILIGVLILAMYTDALSLSRNKNSSAGTVIWSTLGTAAIGGAAYLVIKRYKRYRMHGDSIISYVEKSINSSLNYFYSDNYTSSEMLFRQIMPFWSEYEKYCRKFRHSEILSKSSIESKIEECNILKNYIFAIIKIDSLVQVLPYNEYDLVARNRHEVINVMNIARKEINKIEDLNISNKSVIQFGFRRSLQHIALLDSLFGVVYESERINFDVKCKFFYNRAIEKKDSIAIQQFIDDCDYYHVDKKWRDRAMQALKTISEPVANEKINKKRSVKKKQKAISVK